MCGWMQPDTGNRKFGMSTQIAVAHQRSVRVVDELVERCWLDVKQEIMYNQHASVLRTVLRTVFL